MRFQDALKAWRDANDEARVAENVLSRIWEDCIQRRGPAPTDEQLEEVKALRHAANDRLTEAIKASGTK